MRCYICDVVIAEPRFNSDHDDYEPCEHCLAIIHDTLDGYVDQPSAAEDDFSDDVMSDFVQWLVDKEDEDD